MTEERRAVCLSYAEELAHVLERWDAQRTPAWYRREEERKGVVNGACFVFAATQATEHLDRFLTRVLADKKHYDLHQILIPDVKAIYHWLPKVPAAQPAAERLLQ